MSHRSTLVWLPLLTLACWWHAWLLYHQSTEPLHRRPASTSSVSSLDPSSSTSEEHYYPVLQRHSAQGHSESDHADSGWLSSLLGRWDGTAATSSSSGSTLEHMMDDRPDGVFYFAQVSDIHVSTHRAAGALEHLKVFLNTTLPAVRPQFVLVTGDLTDAKDAWKLSSKQYEEEWIAYFEALRDAGILDRPDFWFDQRGNHDCFDVPGWHSAVNYFSQYSAMKQEQYAFEFRRDYGSYAFVSRPMWRGLDACPTRGPSRPFNFFGILDNADMDYLQQRLKHYRNTSNHTFVMSHYPISTTLTGRTSDGKRFGDLARDFSVFLCGHLHRLAGGLGDILHAHHQEKFLELELGDLKKHGDYRIIAVDHDLISFVDTSILPGGRGLDSKATITEPAPIVLITNPKDARYIIGKHEPVTRIRQSSHIRLLVFSRRRITAVQIVIDGKAHSSPARYVGEDKEATGGDFTPMWVAEWDPAAFDDGRSRSLVAWAVDEDGRNGSHAVQFRVDGVQERISSDMADFVLLSRLGYWIRILFWMIYTFIAVFLLLLPKLYSSYLHVFKRYHRWRRDYSALLIERDRSRPIQIAHDGINVISWTRRYLQLASLRLRLVMHDFRYFQHATTFRLVTLASLKATWYPIFTYMLYIVVAPYFIGELVPVSALAQNGGRKYGAFYVYGMHIHDDWIPLLDTWMFGILELLYIVAPLILYLSFCITPPAQLYAARTPEDYEADRLGTVFFFPPLHNRRNFPIHRNTQVRMMVAGAVLYQLVNVFFMGIFYGPMSVILSPGKTWFVLWACWALWRHRWSEKSAEVALKPESRPTSPAMRRLSEMPASSDSADSIASARSSASTPLVQRRG